MKIFEVKKLTKEDLEFSEKDTKIFKAKIAAHVFFTTDDTDISSVIGDSEKLLIAVLMKKLKLEDYYLESIRAVTKRG